MRIRYLNDIHRRDQTLFVGPPALPEELEEGAGRLLVGGVTLLIEMDSMGAACKIANGRCGGGNVDLHPLSSPVLGAQMKGGRVGFWKGWLQRNPNSIVGKELIAEFLASANSRKISIG